MEAKDSFVFQRERIRGLFIDRFPGFEIEFKPKEDRMVLEFRFRIVEKESVRIIGSIPEDKKWAVSQVADWSDAKILNKIKQIFSANQRDAR